MDELDHEISTLEGAALLAAARARIAQATRGLSGEAYARARDELPRPLRAVHAIDALRGALDATRPDAAIDRRFVLDAIDAMMAIGAMKTAAQLSDTCAAEPAIPRQRLDALPTLALELRLCDERLIALLESHRTFRH